MTTRLVPIRTLSPESFAPFGRLLRLPPDTPEGFHEVVEMRSDGWLVAYSKFSNRDLPKLGLHPNSKECFHPIAGAIAFLAAPEKDPEAIEAFLLDQPLLLNENVWHGMIALSPVCEVKIAENRGTLGRWHPLDPPIRIAAAR